MNWRKFVVTKKLRRYSYAPVRWISRHIERGIPGDRPPVLANSVPKSGTHLLIQVLQAIPDIRDWGLFLASTPSFSYREIAPKRIGRKVRNLAAGELVGAHVFYDPIVEESIHAAGAVSYFIYRDPRDVVVSEAIYLAEMNRWHRLHNVFRRLPDLESRIMLTIEGIQDQSDVAYLDIGSRVTRYLPWLTSEGTAAVRYEDLVGPSRKAAIQKIMEFYCARSPGSLDPRKLADDAASRIDPSRSHTFRKGKAGEWRHHFSSAHTSRFKEVAGDILVNLGYEKDLDW